MSCGDQRLTLNIKIIIVHKAGEGSERRGEHFQVTVSSVQSVVMKQPQRGTVDSGMEKLRFEDQENFLRGLIERKKRNPFLCVSLLHSPEDWRGLYKKNSGYNEQSHVWGGKPAHVLTRTLFTAENTRLDQSCCQRHEEHFPGRGKNGLKQIAANLKSKYHTVCLKSWGAESSPDSLWGISWGTICVWKLYFCYMQLDLKG